MDVGHHPLGDLRFAALVEGSTLVLLMGGAIPLKRLLDTPELTAVMGTVHGLAFLVYGAFVIDAFAAGLIGKWMALRSILLAFVPTGTFWNDPSLRRREDALRSSFASADTEEQAA